jgi:prolipoprotein diacylglyceryltransferase
VSDDQESPAPARGGNGDDIAALAVWAVPAGLVGARLYHVK